VAVGANVCPKQLDFVFFGGKVRRHMYMDWSAGLGLLQQDWNGNNWERNYSCLLWMHCAIADCRCSEANYL